MNKLDVIKTVVSSKLGRGGLILRKASPEILVGIGIAGVVASAIIACRATLKAGDVIDTAKEKMDKIKEAKETVDVGEYTEQDHRKDIAVVYVQTAFDFVVLYGPSIALGAASIACIVSGHNILRKRNLAVIAAYNAVDKSFANYRKRVIDKYGAEEDRVFKHGITKETVKVTDVNEDGTTTESEITIEHLDPNGYSVYSRFFDETATQWVKDNNYNLSYLKAQQNFANDILHSRGHLFLNEVYDLIGVPHSREGAVVGWVKGVGDDFVDFGIFDSENGKARDFVNGYERSILLDFNVSGLIYDKI